MSDGRQRLVQLLRSLVVLGAGNYGAMGLSLAINALLTHRLGAERFGHLTLLLMASQVVLMLTANWTQTGLVRFGAQEFAASGSVREAFWTRIWVVAPWAVAAAIVVGVARAPLAAYLNIPPVGLLLVGAHFAASFFLLTIGGAFQARNEMSRYGVSLFLDKAALLLLLLSPIGSQVQSPLTLLSLAAAGSGAVAFWAAFRLGRAPLLPVVVNRQACRRMLAFCVPLIVSSWVGLLGTNWIDFVIIKHYRPVSEVGIYALGVLLAGVVQQVTIVFSTLLLPQLSVMVAKNELPQIRILADRVLPYWFLATSLLFGLVVMVAPAIVPLVFGAGFARSATILALLMPAASALAIFSAFSPLVSAVGSTWTLTRIYLASGAINVLVDLLLVPRYGLEGSVLATTLSYAASAWMVLAFAGARLHGSLYRVAWFALPVIAICACFVLLHGALFYGAALLSGAATAYALSRRFKLFRGDDARFLESLRLTSPLMPGVWLAARRR